MTVISFSQAEALKNLHDQDMGGDLELVNTHNPGSERQFKLLYQRYAPALLGIIIRIVKSEVLAEDVLQETFVKIWRSMDGFESTRGRLFTWMAKTARTAAIDRLRSKARISGDENFDIGEVAFEGKRKYRIRFSPNTIDLRELNCSLSPSEKQLLDLIYFEGHTYSEAAEQLNIPLNLVKTRLRDAMISLRQNF